MCRERLRRYEAIFEKSPELVCVVGTQGRILDANEHMTQLSGLERQKLLQKNLQDFYDGDAPDWLAAFLAPLRNGQPVKDQVIPVSGLGPVRMLRLSAEPLHSEGKVDSIVIIGSDITVRVRGERARDTRGDILQAIADGIDTVMFGDSEKSEQQLDELLKYLGKATGVSRAYICSL
ncbi:MAG: PAS domain S-box protein, partial [Phycisphaerae bacterium]